MVDCRRADEYCGQTTAKQENRIFLTDWSTVALVLFSFMFFHTKMRRATASHGHAFFLTV